MEERGESKAELARRLGLTRARVTQVLKVLDLDPAVNGKAEAFNKTLQREWAYRRPYTSDAARIDALQPFLDDYNFARPHTALGNRPSASRL